MGILFMRFIEIFITIIGIVMSLGYFPQAYKIYKNKSSENVSIFTFVIFGLGTLSWLIYGLILGNFPIILSFIFGVLGSWLVLILSLIYRRKK